MAEYHVVDPGGAALLTRACAALDRAEQLAEAIAADGATVRTRNGPKPHPGLAIELASRAFVARSIERLGLNLEPSLPARPDYGAPEWWQYDSPIAFPGYDLERSTLHQAKLARRGRESGARARMARRL